LRATTFRALLFFSSPNSDFSETATEPLFDKDDAIVPFVFCLATFIQYDATFFWKKLP
jgi:hypothetical protein